MGTLFREWFLFKILKILSYFSPVCCFEGGVAVGVKSRDALKLHFYGISLTVFVNTCVSMVVEIEFLNTVLHLVSSTWNRCVECF